MKKRSYNKKSPYWVERKNSPVADAVQKEFPTIKYEWDGAEGFGAIAACGGGGSTSYRSAGSGGGEVPLDAYKNIRSGLLPWQVSNGYVSISDAVVLCQLAACNVAVVRNTIEANVEFSSAPIHVKTDNETVKEFFIAWLNKINVSSLANQFFREYYRSGNVFLYKFMGKIEKEQYGQMKAVFGAKSDLLPIRYVIINPAQVYLQGGISFSNNTWTKILSTYEIERLKNPQTPEDKQIYNSLPKETKDAIQNGRSTAFSGIYMPLDPSRLSYIFYKKQDYEPLAIPMVFPVLNDIEWKLELKKMDMSLSRTIEHVILLVTTGEKTDQYGGGVNPQNVDNLKAIFKNQTLGRTLVADYTTTGKWLIPDIGGILGPEKYQQVEKDIKEGLQTILVGDDKFANATIKAKVFIERMKEGQNAFLNNFLLPEIKRICEQMGFRHMPVLEFEPISLDDQSNLMRVFVRLAELGILTPAEIINAIETGVLPDKETNLANQLEYKKQRDNDLYYPLVGGSKEADPGQAGRPGGTKSPQTTKKVMPAKASENTDKIGAKKLAELVIKADWLKETVAASLKKKIGGADLNEAQVNVAEALAKAIIINEEPSKWTPNTIKAYFKEPKEINLEISREVSEIAITYNETDWNAALIRLAKI